MTMLDRKKLKEIAKKLDVSISFASDTPGVTTGSGKSLKTTSFESLLGFFGEGMQSEFKSGKEFFVENKNKKSFNIRSRTW